MAQYIDKAALVAEIRKRFDEYSNSILKHYDACKEAKAQELGKVLIILGTLEVKEVDLKKQVDKYSSQCLKKLQEMGDDDNDLSFLSLDNCAKYFFELGLKAQKGE